MASDLYARLRAEIERRQVAEHIALSGWAASVTLVSGRYERDLRVLERHKPAEPHDRCQCNKILCGCVCGERILWPCVEITDLARSLGVQVGPEIRQPRVWAIPAEPGPGVARIRDAYGQGFTRADAIDEHGTEQGWLGDAFSTEADVPDLFLSWKQLMEHHGPLTEVIEP